MEMKSVGDCLNSNDSVMLCYMEKHVGIGNLEDLPDYLIGMYDEKYIEEMVAVLAIFSQINLIIEKFYSDKENDIKKQNCTLRKRFLSWLEVCTTEPEIDDQQ